MTLVADEGDNRSVLKKLTRWLYLISPQVLIKSFCNSRIHPVNSLFILAIMKDKLTDQWFCNS